MMPLRLRPAIATDEDFLLELAKRLADFERPAWRTAEEIAAVEDAPIRAALAEPSDETAILVAEDSTGERVGYLMMVTQKDFFTGRPNPHLSILAVAPGQDGRGVGSFLLEAAEDWARRRGSGFLTLTVFCANERARRLYDRNGWQPEVMRYRKNLDPA